jgi:hypothetical protein
MAKVFPYEKNLYHHGVTDFSVFGLPGGDSPRFSMGIAVD